MKVMSIFSEFYATLLGFVNYRLYHTLNLMYPPKLAITAGGHTANWSFSGLPIGGSDGEWSEGGVKTAELSRL